MCSWSRIAGFSCLRSPLVTRRIGRYRVPFRPHLFPIRLHFQSNCCGMVTSETMGKRKQPSVSNSSITQPSKIADYAHTVKDSTSATGSRRGKHTQPKPAKVDPNPESNDKVIDGQEALRASPDALDIQEDGRQNRKQKQSPKTKPKTKRVSSKAATPSELSDSSLSDLPDIPEDLASQPKKVKSVSRASTSFLDPEADTDEVDADAEELLAAVGRPPPVNSAYLPLPWTGRLGYACLNTYLRSANPPVFSSRTCRIASILENRHPLKDPKQPAHATKNRPDKDKPADVNRGQAFVEGLGLANAWDIPKMLRWNEKYGIKFLRLSSEMFPFASHQVYGYKLAPFASEALGEAGRVAAELGHRLTTHPGQFSQLGSPRKEVIEASFRDLEYHAELLSLLKLPNQLDKDAVMILHMGGIFGDKAATLDRFRESYARLDQGIKNRLVLENDDVCYTLHDLLPICEELNIPLVLDYHHHNILFDHDKIREGTLDIIDLYPRIAATWTRKGITQKMHYSEPTAGAITGRQRRKHNPRPATLPPCAPNMDLMIEAKDKEQAVFELMRTLKLPKFDSFNDLIPYTRQDENRPGKAPATKKSSRKSKKEHDDEGGSQPEEILQPPPPVPEEEVGMGGPQNRVYWPPGMEEWLRPKKREVKKKEVNVSGATTTAVPAQKSKKTTSRSKVAEVNDGVEEDRPSLIEKPAPRNKKTAAKTAEESAPTVPAIIKPKQHQRQKAAPARKPLKRSAQAVPTPSTSNAEEEEEEEAVKRINNLNQRVDIEVGDENSTISSPKVKRRRIATATATATAAASVPSSTSGRRQSGRSVKKAAAS